MGRGSRGTEATAGMLRGSATQPPSAAGDEHYDDPDEAWDVAVRVTQTLREITTMRENCSASERLDDDQFWETGEPSDGPERYIVEVWVPEDRPEVRAAVLKVAGGPVVFQDSSPIEHMPDLSLNAYGKLKDDLGCERVEEMLTARGLENVSAGVLDTLDGIEVWGADDAESRAAVRAMVQCPVKFRRGWPS